MTVRAVTLTPTRRTRSPRMATVRAPGAPDTVTDLSAERVQNERVLVSPKLKRLVGAYARSNGLTLPQAWRDLTIAGLKFTKERDNGTATTAE